MNKVLVVGVGNHQKHGINWLKEKGYTVFGIDENKEAISSKICDYFFHVNFEEFNQILAIVSNYGIDFSIAFECDAAVSVVNQINKILNNNNIKEDLIRTSLDKFFLRSLYVQFMNDARFMFTRIQKQKDIADLKLLVEKNYVIKPLDSSGSRGVRLVNNKSDLVSIYNTAKIYSSDKRTVILEDFVDGQEIAIDGFFLNGKLLPLTISYKCRTMPPYLMDEYIVLSTNLGDNSTKEAILQLESLVNTLDAKVSSPIHAEFIVTKDRVFLVEYSLRGAGFNVFSKWMQEITGLDNIQTLVDMTIKSKLSINGLQNKSDQSILLGFFGSDKSGVVNNISLSEEFRLYDNVLDFSLYIKPGEHVNVLTSGADRIGHIVIKGQHQNIVSEFNRIKQKINISLC